ncbi:hypothetical protein Ddc_13061 [Ditylenchus destructor]|nr:hypothetical protein Ddc_13061 [Ditylenchus destructor]
MLTSLLNFTLVRKNRPQAMGDGGVRFLPGFLRSVCGGPAKTQRSYPVAYPLTVTRRNWLNFLFVMPHPAAIPRLAPLTKASRRCRRH